jgi:nucleotide-binding universal stress UspA family protein
MKLMHHVSRVLLATEAASRSTAALAAARTCARLFDVPLHVVFRADRSIPLEEVRRLMDLPADSAAGAMVEEVVGPGSEEILRRAKEERDTLVVLAREPGLQPVVEDILGEDVCPLLMIPARGVPPSWWPRRILMPQDGKPASASALCPAIELAEHAGASVHFLHVSGETPAKPGALGVPRIADQPQHEWTDWTRDFLERVRHLCGHSREAEMRLARGDPAEEIVRRAAEGAFDLIALVWRREADTLRAVLRNAPCPVLALPPVTARRGGGA